MKVIQCVQGSEEWKLARCCRVTASRIPDVLSRARGGKEEGATRRRYKAQIISEILTERPQEDPFTNDAMDNGIELEPVAADKYAISRDVELDKVGLVVHPVNDRTAASPDRLIAGVRGLVQIKCPMAHTHIDYMLDGGVPSKYQPQMLWEMECAEADFCDFVSFCPSLPPHLSLHVVRLTRDAKRIIEIAAEVSIFLNEVDEIIERLNRKAA